MDFGDNSLYNKRGKCGKLKAHDEGEGSLIKTERDVGAFLIVDFTAQRSDYTYVDLLMETVAG